MPEELTQVRMGKIVQERYPDLTEADQEAVRQHAVAALNLTQKAMEAAQSGADDSGAQPQASTALIDGVRKFAMDVRDLDIDLIDRINPFGKAYAILAKTMSEESLNRSPRSSRRRRCRSRPTRRASSRNVRSGSSANTAACRPSHRPTPGRNAWPKASPSSPA